MSDYLIHGKKGHGKSLVSVGRIKDALEQGRPVATNLNLNLEKLLGPGVRNIRCIRLPDRPTIEDMELLGLGSAKLDESTYGEIVLDEMATWMNARSWADKERQKLLDWFVHSRKKRWNTNFICQSPDQIDKQIRTSLMDHSVNCKRLDKMRIPMIGSLTKLLFGYEIRPPKVHVAKVRFGMDINAQVTDTWTYLGRHLYAAYDTEQVFRDNYEHGVFSYLSPWHIHGRHLVKLPKKPSEHVRDFFRGVPRRRVQPRPKNALVALIMALPVDQRMKHYRRFQQAGAL